VPDLDRLAKKFQRSKATLPDCVSLYHFIVRLPILCEVFSSYTGQHQTMMLESVIQPLQRLMADLAPLETMIEQTIDLTAAEQHEFCINPSFSPELTELHDEKTSIKKQIDKSHAETADDLGGDSVKLQFTQQAGWHMRVSRKDEKLLRGQKGVITLETRKDGVRFTTSALKSLSRSYLQCCAQYESVQSEIVTKALEIVASYTPVVEDATELFASLDCLVSFASASVSAPEPYVRPHLLPLGSGRIELLAARHPCLEAQDSVAFIANDIELVNGKSALQIVTGPNMGGKSTYIRSVGVVCLMAQIGCFVPCSKATITVVDAILARVGASDSTLRGVSTFMAEVWPLV
jgi:DNA mismatch repair protein MSH2